MKKRDKNTIIYLSIGLGILALTLMATAWGWDNVFNFFLYNEKAYLIYAIIAVFGLMALFLFIKPKRD